MPHEQSQHRHSHSIEVADQNLVYRQVHLQDRTPTGAQIAAAAGFTPDQSPVILQMFESGAQEDIRPDETADLSDGINRFIVVESDRKYLLKVDGARFEWPCKFVSGHTIRKLADIGPGKRLLLEREDEPDQEIEDAQLVSLAGEGIEPFITRKAIWKLNIQGEIYEFDKPVVTVREAIVAADLNPNHSWQIFLMVRDQPKKPLEIGDSIDLRPAGIEKLRLTQKDVNNGEAALQLRRDFKLLPRDEQYLNAIGHRWETRNTSEGGRWLVIHDYVLPAGYSATVVQLALNIPPTYPNTKLDMFYVYPAVRLANGAEIAQTQVVGHIDGITFQGWSRHRSWDPATDNVVTQLAMTDGCLLKEVGL
ncbi:TPA: multiubiquitin domain-containing protein [Pseudomonas aeruginosa]|uniref:multiubiquitin domain-containing protein n=1 Tax=Pseudomonas lopnurensis TaxID=1477517 RepID=UPI0028AAD143|nr:multiubiquitin domain-containing protein [Pseudomonas lopnurensis]HEP9652495.1 multiubiquitin domain-containing protein [Pseudomonas aeruginosa]HEP9661096.1 multiubiquitin domain-containing protein [Pseudomonas aeruginosa]HEP9684917.1 multiubiquitin domain-containing protein [Pseudomonas aeruginosa]